MDNALKIREESAAVPVELETFMAQALQLMQGMADMVRATNERMAAPTKYAVKRGAQTNEDSTLANGMKTGWWWLRTPASSSNRAADVDCYGNIDVDFIKGSDVDGSLVFDEDNCVRPAVWITIAEAKFSKVL